VRVGSARALAGVTARRAAGIARGLAASLVTALLGLAGLPAAAGCGRSGDAPDVVVEWALTPEAPGVGPAQLDLVLRTADRQPVEATRVAVEGHMNHPGMAPVLADAERQAPGEYAARFSLTMRGDWILLVRADLPGGRRVEHRIDVRVVGPGG
jgi:hypothetical protein